MTPASIAPVIPRISRTGAAESGSARSNRRPPPLPHLAGLIEPAAETVYALSAVDKSGRLADRSIVRVLGWTPGVRLSIRERDGLVVVRSADQGVRCLDERGHLHLPLTVRRWCRIAAGDRLLVVADRCAAVLVVYPVTVLDRLLAGSHTAAMGGAA